MRFTTQRDSQNNVEPKVVVPFYRAGPIRWLRWPAREPFKFSIGAVMSVASTPRLKNPPMAILPQPRKTQHAKIKHLSHLRRRPHGTLFAVPGQPNTFQAVGPKTRLLEKQRRNQPMHNSFFNVPEDAAWQRVRTAAAQQAREAREARAANRSTADRSTGDSEPMEVETEHHTLPAPPYPRPRKRAARSRRPRPEKTRVYANWNALLPDLHEPYLKRDASDGAPRADVCTEPGCSRRIATVTCVFWKRACGF